MSSLLKSGFTNFKPMNSEPFVIDSNTKVIKSITETKNVNSESNNDENHLDENVTSTNREILDDAMIKAKLLRDDAKDKADKIIEDALAEAEIIKQKAHDEGYELGLANGNEEAMKRADEYLLKLQTEHDEMLRNNEQELDQYAKELEDKMINLSCGLIEKITGILVDDYKEVMLHIINNALSGAESSTRYTIKVSSNKYAYVSDNLERLYGAANPNVVIDIFSDNKLEAGQCIIETDNGIIDLSMDVQVKNLITAIKMMS